MTGPRVADYDSIAARYDCRYDLHEYAGVRDTLRAFVGESRAILEVGCGTGHWLTVLNASAESPAEGRALLAGVEPSPEMIARAHGAAPAARLVRARAEMLPWRDAVFDRVFCVNALHHFADRARFFTEARRVLKPGGGLLTVGKDP